MTAEAQVMASNESREELAQRLLEWEQRARDAEDRVDALAAALEGLREPSIQLAETVENRDDLPIHKWAIKCARLVNQVREASQEDPAASLARRDARIRAEGGESALAQVAVEMRQNNDRGSKADLYGLARHLEECARACRHQAKESQS